LIYIINITPHITTTFKMSAIKNISLYIPHIFANYGKTDVAAVFENLKIGKVQDIDFVSKMGQDGKPFNAAYIHFEYWYDNISAANFQERVLHKSPAKIMYEEPWFWLVLENKGKKIVSGERKKCIDLGDLRNSNNNDVVNKGDELKKLLGIIPGAPVKEKKNTTLNTTITPVNLDDHFVNEDDDEYVEMMYEMAECEAAMEEDDKHLISIDGRYVQELEQENVYLREQIVQLQNAYYTESVKSQGLAEALQIINNKTK